MGKKFRSLRKKLVLKLGVTYLVALLFVFALIIIKNTLDFNATIADTQARLKSSLINKGMILVQNNSIALGGLVEDNAFGAVEQIVTNTVQSSNDIVYGIFSDIDKNDWAYIFVNDYFKSFKHIVDKNNLWAYKQQQAASKSLHFQQLQVIEFTAPVIVDDELLGIIRYGLSTAELAETIATANKQATASLQQILMVLIAIGAVTLLLVHWRTDNLAKNITVPLNMLTDAANIVARGDYSHVIDIRTNDEIGILASNFNSMTDKIKRTIADLAKINHVGNELATSRNEASTFKKVLQNLVSQLEFQSGIIFRGNNKSELTLMASYDINDIKMEPITAFIKSNQEIKATLDNPDNSSPTLIVDVQGLTNNNYYKSLVFMPFGKQNITPLFIALLSEKPNKCIESSELTFCLSISHLLVTSLQNIAMNDLLEEQNKNLEIKVSQRTQELHVQNQALSHTLTELEQTQTQLIEAEKMASLGSLVAGISHEVNTPLGVAVTAASHLNQNTKEFKFKHDSGNLTKSGFISYMESTTETTNIILSNLNRASILIQSFKQIAVDQSSDNKTVFSLKQHLEMLVTSLRPSFKNLPIDINIYGDEIDIDSYPGPLSQIVSNLIMNCIKHGLTDCEKGEITIIIAQYPKHITLSVEDNGVGIANNIKNKVFDPFFTTQRGIGGSGLGLNIVYNLIKQKLGGNIIIEDNKPQGVRFIISLPV
ncbi:MAG: signal transduction histidine kinase/HAMP domain-containing protein [Polaribacter sp.]|jgi:signal transduction histidine kinase/HAMP domain-containing protein